jgi:hypothetical protein
MRWWPSQIDIGLPGSPTDTLIPLTCIRYTDLSLPLSIVTGVQLKPEAALGNTLAAIVTFLLYGELQWFRHFPHI